MFKNDSILTANANKAKSYVWKNILTKNLSILVRRIEEELPRSRKNPVEDKDKNNFVSKTKKHGFKLKRYDSSDSR